MSNLTIYQVDAFAHEPFSGNPAGVCFPEEPLADAFMQDVALEMNLSETAFLRPAGDGYDLRWFTPWREVDLCGHATLASAHVLWETGRLARDADALFYTRSGKLGASLEGKRIVMDFPAEPPEMGGSFPEELGRGLGVEVLEVGTNRLDYFVVLPTDEEVRTLVPDMNLLAGVGLRGVIVTARSGAAGHDFVSRYFAPRFGIPEDPVTGSAHCALAPFWCRRLGSERLTGFQASPRGGTVHVLYAGGDRVQIGGTAITTARVEMLVSPLIAGAL